MNNLRKQNLRNILQSIVSLKDELEREMVEEKKYLNANPNADDSDYDNMEYAMNGLGESAHHLQVIVD